jgi:NitT/TauT family transport system ATP-binding protein
MDATFQNVIYGPLVQRDKRRDEIEANAIVLLEHVGLKDFKDKYPSQLSGGMQRRAELARAIINNPKLMILDESFRDLDAMTRELMQEYFLKLYEGRKQSVFFVTSEIEEAIFLADQLLIMSNRPGQSGRRLSRGLCRSEPITMSGVVRRSEAQNSCPKSVGLLSRGRRVNLGPDHFGRS